MAVIVFIARRIREDQTATLTGDYLRPRIESIVERQRRRWQRSLSRKTSCRKSVELATETRPPAAQISQSFTSGANAPVATLAQASAVV